MTGTLRSAIQAAITAQTGIEAILDTCTPVGGGCIHETLSLRLKDERIFFAKVSRSGPQNVFEREREGLQALGRGSGMSVLRPIATGVTQDGAIRFLVTEWIESGSPGVLFFEEFGRRLARLHRALPGRAFGFDSDNYLGRTVQRNGWNADWCSFWREHRLGFQLRLARANGYRDRTLHRLGTRLMDRLDEWLGGLDDSPCLIHGDLWSGNFLIDPKGRAVLIDPAVYYGTPEAELAMSRLFGGFDPVFFEAYAEVCPNQPGWRERQSIYQLYHLLNHLNLFGRGYLGQCLSLLKGLVG